MKNIEHGRMILESVEHSLLIWPTIEENGVTRIKKYEELSATEKIQVDYDLKATNIILQGLPSDVYSLIYHHRVAKDLWERIQLLMQVNQQTHLTEFPQIDSCLVVLVFKQRDDPIDAVNKMMSVLVTVQAVQGKQSLFAASNFRTRANISRIGHMARQCPKPRRKRDATWFRDKVLQVEVQGSSNVLNEEELEFLADRGVAEGPVTQTVITYNVAYQANDLYAYDSDCDDLSIAKVVLMANLSSYGSDVLSEAPHSKITHNDMLNQSVQEM
ncbi:hypothetical protein Tco_0045085 [Tanacetum coccineum]